MKRWIPLAAMAAMLTACSTELDVKAPYKDITVVYGLLSINEQQHFVKINKAFLGDGDALVMAMIPDSSEYDPEELGTGEFGNIRVEQWNNNNLVATHWLRDTIVEDREPGIFFNPVQRLYYFNATLDPTHLYRFVGDIRGERITATTDLVRDFSPASTLLANTPLNLMGPGNTYGSFNIRWNTGIGGKRYDPGFRFRYLEVRGTDTIPRAVARNLGTRLAMNADQGGQQMEILLDGETFFVILGNAIPADAAVTKRIFTGLDITFGVANEDFTTYLAVTDPVTGIVEERPPFTNVENGFGLFASRFSREIIGRRFNDVTVNELINGQYTGHLNFCSSFNPGGQYGCE